MKEQDFFDIMDGLPARQIAEAAEWKYQNSKEQPNEIDSILTSNLMPERTVCRITPPEPKGTAEEQAAPPAPAGRPQQQPRIIRSAAAGLAAVAALFVLAFGGIALKLYRDNTEITASHPGTALSDGEAVMTEITRDGSEHTDILTTMEIVFQTSEPGTTVTFSVPETPVEYTEDSTVSAGETNFLGGHGLLRPVNSEEQPCILQDDDYYYLYGSERIRKTSLDPHKQPEITLICQKAGCAHTTDDCLLYKYGNGHLMCSGQDIYYMDWETESLHPGYAGGLKRIFSDGTTEELHPQKKIKESDESSGKISGRIYYSHILRLGNTGIYYLKDYTMQYYSDSPNNITDNAPVLLNSRTGETIMLPFINIGGDDYADDYAVMYDEKSGHLFMSISDSADICTAVDEIDIYTGEVLQEYRSTEQHLAILSWFVTDHKLHFLGESPQNGYGVSWYVCDMDTLETGVILEDCDLSSFAYCDGRVYATYHASVGNDAVYSYAADGTDKVVLTESNTLFRWLAPVSSPDSIVIHSNTGSIYLLLPDGKTYRLM